MNIMHYNKCVSNRVDSVAPYEMRKRRVGLSVLKTQCNINELNPSFVPDICRFFFFIS